MRSNDDSFTIGNALSPDNFPENNQPVLKFKFTLYEAAAFRSVVPANDVSTATNIMIIWQMKQRRMIATIPFVTTLQIV